VFLLLFPTNLKKFPGRRNFLGERVLGSGLALEILDVFLKTEFEGGRHKARVDQIDADE
jgi:Ribose/Galactose Isomerase